MDKGGTLIGGYAPDFEIPGVDSSVHHLAQYLKQYQAVGVVFMCNHCPYVKLYLDRLKQLQANFASQNFTLIGINSNDAEQYPEDSFDNMKLFATEHQLNFPYLRDLTQEVAQSFGAQKTPHAFLLNKEGVVCYSGSIDDSPHDPSSVRVSYLRDAIAQVLQGENITATSTEPVGCSVKWKV